MSQISKLRRLQEAMRPKMERAQDYVGTDEVSGKLQFDLLTREGMQRDSQVLEIGCGSLSAGAHLIRFLNPDRYVGIEPNKWLIDTALRDRSLREAVSEKKAVFLHGLDFDASSTGRKFDSVLSHSILSHAAHHQLEEFLRNTAKVLAANGVIVASIRLAEGNKYGSTGSPNGDDSRDKEWVYPGVSWFKQSTVMKTAQDLNLRAVYRPDYTEFYVAGRPRECHDWFTFKKMG